MKKIIGYVLLILVLLIIIAGSIGIQKFNSFITKEAPNYLSYSYESKPIHFDWSNDSIGDYLEKQTAMIIPFKMKGLAHRFYMQFDTGSPFSFIYERQLNSLRDLGFNFKEVVIDEERYVEEIEIILDSMAIKLSMIKIYPSYGYSFELSDSNYRIGLGTIGSDFIDNRITTIDFKNQKIQLYEDRPNWMANLSSFKAFDYTDRRRIMLPVVVDNKKYEFLYDSGCSAFGLITIKSRYNKYTNEADDELGYSAKSWEGSIPIVSKLSDHQFSVGNANLSLKRVSYIDMYTVTQPLVTPFTRIGGWMGNQPFNEAMMILDTKTEEFLVVKE